MPEDMASLCTLPPCVNVFEGYLHIVVINDLVFSSVDVRTSRGPFKSVKVSTGHWTRNMALIVMYGGPKSFQGGFMVIEKLRRLARSRLDSRETD
jgi:hypothetical protein